VNSDRRHGACDFGDESTVSSRRLLLRHNQGRRKLLAPTGIFPCSSLRVIFWSIATRSIFSLVHPNPPFEFAVHVGGLGGRVGSALETRARRQAGKAEDRGLQATMKGQVHRSARVFSQSKRGTKSGLC
jgi:hypothetical protein